MKSELHFDKAVLEFFLLVFANRADYLEAVERATLLALSFCPFNLRIQLISSVIIEVNLDLFEELQEPPLT